MRKMNGKQAQKGIDRDLRNSNGKKKQKKHRSDISSELA